MKTSSDKSAAEAGRGGCTGGGAGGADRQAGTDLAAACGRQDIFPELRHVTDPVWIEALRSAKEVTIPPRTVVIRHNDPCQQFLWVAQGTIRIYQRTEDGREHVLYRTRAGELCILTLRTLLAGERYSAEAITEDEVRVVSLPVTQFKRLLAEVEPFREFVFSTLALRLNDMMQLVEQVSFKALDLRLACLLGQHFSQRGTACLRVTHQELANELGTTREVISRLLKEFERKGCIKLYRGQIEIISPLSLARLSRTSDM